jgi:hypothetical protein
MNAAIFQLLLEFDKTGATEFVRLQRMLSLCPSFLQNEGVFPVVYIQEPVCVHSELLEETSGYQKYLQRQ